MRKKKYLGQEWFFLQSLRIPSWQQNFCFLCEESIRPPDLLTPEWQLQGFGFRYRCSYQAVPFSSRKYVRLVCAGLAQPAKEGRVAWFACTFGNAVIINQLLFENSNTTFSSFFFFSFCPASVADISASSLVPSPTAFRSYSCYFAHCHLIWSLLPDQMHFRRFICSSKVVVSQRIPQSRGSIFCLNICRPQ